MENFLTVEQFSEASKSQLEKIVPWRDVPREVIYRIEDVEEITTKIGRAKVVSLVDASGEWVRAFTTSILNRDLGDLNWCGSCYIKPLALKQSSSSDKSYYHYELAKEDD